VSEGGNPLSLSRLCLLEHTRQDNGTRPWCSLWRVSSDALETSLLLPSQRGGGGLYELPISNQVRLPAELKHISKRRKRN